MRIKEIGRPRIYDFPLRTHLGPYMHPYRPTGYRPKNEATLFYSL